MAKLERTSPFGVNPCGRGNALLMYLLLLAIQITLFSSWARALSLDDACKEVRRICPGPWANEGLRTACATQALNDLRRSGSITSSDRQTLHRRIADGDCLASADDFCRKQMDGTTCNDGSNCTRHDSCQSGFCVGQESVICSALSQCHEVGLCEPIEGKCSTPTKADGTPCNDGDACTGEDVCQKGACTSKPIFCDDGDFCTQDSCDSTSGCFSVPVPVDQNVLTLKPSAGLLTTERGTQTTFSAGLGAPITTDVTLLFQVNKSNEAVLDTNSLTFTASNWNSPQSVTVTGLPDNRPDWHESVAIGVEIMSDDPRFACLGSRTVGLTNKATRAVLRLEMEPEGAVGTGSTFALVFSGDPRVTDTLDACCDGDGFLLDRNQVYLLDKNDIGYRISMIPHIDGTTDVRIGVRFGKAPVAEKWTFTYTEDSTPDFFLPPDVSVLLIDKQTGSTIDIRRAREYHFAIVPPPVGAWIVMENRFLFRITGKTYL